MSESTAQRRLPQPLAGLTVVEFTHMVMGPTCGMVLADLGADVIKVEPIDGDRTRTLLGAGIGFFPMFNRNKKSIQIDLHKPAGAAVARQLATRADVVAENFKPGTMVKYGLDCALRQRQPAPHLCQLERLLARPVRPPHRTRRGGADDGRPRLHDRTPGRPLRAGSSVNDIMGGMFGAIAILGALIQRGITGRGMEVQSALFENNVFLVGQHMLQYAITGSRRRRCRRASARGRSTTCSRSRTTSRSSRGGERCAVAHLLRRARFRRPEGRSGAQAQQRPRARAAHATGRTGAPLEGIQRR
jgi:crotonobetainyl-CoA:carnitine CoA-transferase CaiB-like acyl-CoA transferase